MTEQIVKTIPSKGTRFKAMLVIEAFASVILILAIFGQVDPSMGIDASWWSAFTQFNLSIYAGSESVVKGAEGFMNKGNK